MSLQQMLDLATEHAGWFVAGSLLSFVVGLVLAPLLILRLPADYFAYERRYAVAKTRRHPFMYLLLTGIKNLAGAVLIVAGLCLLVLPGQGIIALLAGLVVTNYPGKFRLERWLVRRPHVLPALNWLRFRCSGRMQPLFPGTKHAPRRHASCSSATSVTRTSTSIATKLSGGPE